MLLSTVPAQSGERHAGLAAALLLLVAVLCSLAFAQMPVAPFPAFVLIQQSLLLANDLITAALLFGQYAIARTSALNILAGGYLFTALIVIPHALSFPGAFSPSGQLIGGSQSAAWLYLGWHAVLPITIIAFVLKRHGKTEENPSEPGSAMLRPGLAAICAVIAMTMVVTVLHEKLPPLIESGYYTLSSRIAVAVLLVLPLVALLILSTRRPHSVLDLALMLVMFAWLCTILLGALASGGRYDVGWYAGRIFDWLTSLFVLLTLLWQTIGLYAQNIKRAAVERAERERRLKQMETLLVHLSRVNDMGQNVSVLIHEVNQPLTAVFGYLSAAAEIAKSGGSERLKLILERSAEQAARAMKIIQLLRDFVARREPEKRVEDLHELLQDAVRLALAGIAANGRTSVEINCAPGALTAFCNRIQIEQVVFNLARNAMEAMAHLARRELVIETKLDADEMVEVRVCDNGTGVSSAIQEGLFEPFVTNKVNGLGVGLSICRIIIEAHGGRLRADDNPGGGAVFHFTLPSVSPEVL